MDITALANYAGLLMGVASFIGGWVLWYKGSVEKRYAAQRDFGHLKNNYQQLAMNLEAVAKEQDRRFDSVEKDLREIKLILQLKGHSIDKEDRI